MKRFLTVFIVLSILLAISSCGSAKSPHDIVAAICDDEVGRPAGKIYQLSAEEGEGSYVSDTMLTEIYGFDRLIKGLEDGAFWLSESFHPFEAAVFLCRDYRSAEDIAMHLKKRLTLLQNNASESSAFCKMTVDDYKNYVNNGIVLISGEYVSLIISSDPQTAKATFLNIR